MTASEIDRLRARLVYERATGVFTWLDGPHSGMVAGSVNGIGYVQISANGKRHLAHRLAWAFHFCAWPTADIDHINGNRTDNRIENLRHVSRRVNLENMRGPRSDNVSGGLLGVEGRGNRFRARIQVKGKVIPIGTFATADAAHAAYVDAKRRLHEGNTL